MESGLPAQTVSPTAIEVQEDALSEYLRAVDELIAEAEINNSPAMGEAASGDRKWTLLFSSILIVLASGYASLNGARNVAGKGPVGANTDTVNITTAIADLIKDLTISIKFSHILLLLLALYTYYLASFLVAADRSLKRWSVRGQLWQQRAESILAAPRQEARKAQQSAEKAIAEMQEIQDFLLPEITRRGTDWVKFLYRLKGLLQEASTKRKAAVVVDGAPQPNRETMAGHQIEPLEPVIVDAIKRASIDEMQLNDDDRKKLSDILSERFRWRDFNDSTIDAIIERIRVFDLMEKDEKSDLFMMHQDSRKRHREAINQVKTAEQRAEMVTNTANAMQHSRRNSIVIDIVFPCVLYIWSLLALVVWFHSQ